MIAAQDTKFINSTPPAAIIDNASATVTEIDTLGYDYCQIVVVLGATDIAMTALAVTESDSAGSGHANVTGLVTATSADIAGDTSALPTASDDDGIFLFEIDLKTRKRYLDLTATCGDGSAGTYITVLTILSRGEKQLTTATARGCSQILRV